jgi:ubiquinone/menaquinone biosynthesis C-methylase UbiE
MKRSVIPEFLDDDLGTAEEIAGSLRDLRRINIWFGGRATATVLVRRVAAAGHRELSLLEVGSGSGDLPLWVSGALATEGIRIRVTLLDREASHLPRNGTPAVAADALQLPFSDSSFDIVSSTLLAHHFEPGDLRRAADECLRVCRVATLVNDLVRSRMHLALVYAGLPLFRSRLTWHDAPASVRRAYTLEEMRSMLSKTSARRVEISRHYLYRMGILLWK